ncbi:hypothetical protein QFZ52_002938 [Arthrobacter woluwensis]|uniref:hypothetical protein n=1 Tax=Arthrobacter woluwensis TaxID=156980 RepID=UPI00278B8636|nr:hypothetical protein [Arthrobacter woluwensis]MDQ0710286.1 hypothetical protein [Arthrobacter woluwensis]
MTSNDPAADSAAQQQNGQARNPGEVPEPVEQPEPVHQPEPVGQPEPVDGFRPEPFGVPAPQPHGVPTQAPALPPTPDHAPRPPRKSRKGLVIALVAALVVVLGIGGVGLWALVRGPGGGATPTAAVTNVIDGIGSHDLLKLTSIMAPSEAKFINQVTQEAAKLKPSGGLDTLKRSQDAFQSLNVKENSLTFSEEKIADGVTFVEITSGRLVIDGDAEKIAELQSTASEAGARDRAKATGADEEEIKRELERQKEKSLEQLKRMLPLTIDVDSLHRQLGPATQFGLVTVKEGDWYISPMMSGAELGRQMLGRHGSKADRGSRVVDAKRFDTPEAAAKGMFDGLAATLTSGAADPTPFAETLPLAERRLVSIYGGSLMNPAVSRSLRQLEFTVQEAGGDAKVDGDVARINLKLGAEIKSRNGAGGAALQIADSCVWMTPLGGFGDAEKRGGCLKDVELLRNIGLDTAPLVAVKEGGGWLASPLGTVADFSARFMVAIEPCVKDDRFAENCVKQ